MTDNRHLNFLVESNDVNVGGSRRDAKASSLLMTVKSVGGSIVVGGRESRPQGEGNQFVARPEQTNRVLTKVKSDEHR
jgi:hypothetical protein